MAIKRADLREILSGVEVTDEHIKNILSLFHGEIDTVKDERDELKKRVDELEKMGGNETEKWKQKYEKEHKDFEGFKEKLKAEEERKAKTEAFKSLLEDTELSEKGKAMAVKYTDLSAVQIVDGKIKDGKDLLKSVSEEWADYKTQKSTSGKHTEGKKTNEGGMTKEEILKIEDTEKRQKAIAENIELFR